MNVRLCAVAIVVMNAALAPLATYGQEGMGTAFTYQGQLKHSGSPHDGPVDLEFRLWDAQSAGAQVGPTVTANGVQVTNGLFAVTLDFGEDCFTGEARWLGIAINGTPLSQRQELTPAPYALALPGFRTQQDPNSPNLIGGYSGNIVEPGVAGATISGGGDAPEGGDYQYNRATSSYCTVGGGRRNLAGHGSVVGAALHATVGGGERNVATEDHATVGGGYLCFAHQLWGTVAGGSGNWAQANHGTIRGGWGNKVRWYAACGTVGGGKINRIDDYADYGTIAGGGQSGPVPGGENRVTDAYGAIGGGGFNVAGNEDGDRFNAQFATVGGGRHNTATGSCSTVPGGGTEANWDVLRNVAAGAYSLGAGRRAKADHDGAFIWSSGGSEFPSVSNDEFAACCPGGARLVTGIDGSGTPTAGVYLPPGGGSWSDLSDRNLKENVAPTDSRAVLARLARVPISTWSYKAQDASIRHMGPMAQDFYAGFGVAEDDRHISSVDADGVALAAIQGLYGIVREQDTELSELRARLERLKAIVSAPTGTQTGGAR